MKNRFLGVLWSSILCLIACSCQISPPPSEPPLWGMALDGNPLTDKRLDQVEAQTGLPFQIAVFFLQWPERPDLDNFPTESLAAIGRRGAIPCLTWEPMYYADGQAVTVEWQRIVSGAYDPYLTVFAGKARNFGRPLIIRLAHEMNLNHYHWGTTPEGYGPESPEIYKRIYRYVVELFRKEGVDNVLWAFAPNVESVPTPGKDGKNNWNRVANYYPGHTYVDILGMDGYNWGPVKTLEKDGWQSRWQSFDEIFAPLYGELQFLAPTKRIVVFETASNSVGGDKEKWLADALTTAQNWHLAGLVWFEVEKEQDWRLATGIDKEYIPLVRAHTSITPREQWWLTEHPR